MRLSLIAVAALCVSSLAAHADTIQYQINAPLSDGGLFSGLFTYNSSNALASTLVGATTNSRTSGTVNGSAQVQGFGSGYTYLGFFENSGYAVDIVYPGSSFAGVLCTTASTNCGGQPSTIGGVANFLGTTTVTQVPVTSPAAVTPEPSSLALLGTGMLGIVGMVRKRFA